MATGSLLEAVQINKALGHPARTRIMAMLRSGELCACQVTAVLNLAPSTVSAHLRELRRAGLVDERKDGRWIYYGLRKAGHPDKIVDWLWQRVKTDPQVISDAAFVEQLRALPVEELCRVELDVTKLALSRGDKTDGITT